MLLVAPLQQAQTPQVEEPIADFSRPDCRVWVILLQNAAVVPRLAELGQSLGSQNPESLTCFAPLNRSNEKKGGNCF